MSWNNARNIIGWKNGSCEPILTLSFFFLKALCTRLLIPDLNMLCGIEVLRVKNQVSGPMLMYGRQVGQVMTTNLSSCQNPHVVDTIAVGFSAAIPHHPSFMALSRLMGRHDRSFVAHLLEPAASRCLYGDLFNLGVQYGRFWSSLWIFLKHFQSQWCHKPVLTLQDCFIWVICWEIYGVIVVCVVYSQLLHQGVVVVLLARNYHIVGSSVCRDKNIISI